MELRQAIEQGIAITLERDSIITGYAAGIGIFSYAVVLCCMIPYFQIHLANARQ